jgi:hypothetical protein
LLAFAKLYGTVFLGRSRSLFSSLKEPSGAAFGFLSLAALTAALGVLAPWEIRWLGSGLEGLLGFDPASTTVTQGTRLVLGPVYENFSVLSPTWLAVVLSAYALGTALLVRTLSRPRTRRAPAWTSGTQLAPARVQYTPASYSNPIRVVLRGAYGFRRGLQTLDSSGRSAERYALETRVVPAFEHYLYLPVATLALRASQQARRLQSGRLSTYLLYTLVVLLIILALVPALRS